MVIKSFAKVNLFLEVINKRHDNYHNLKTIFERVSLSDNITLITRKDNRIKIHCNDPAVPLDESNFCWQAAKLLQDKFRIKEGVDIKIIKRIPVAAGLGGGSSNAASVLIGLNKLWRLKLSQAALAKFAGKLGSDVSFFVYNVPFAQGLNRGEKIRILSRMNKLKLWHILVVPEIHVSTPLVYKKWDNFSGLTKPGCNVNILTSILAKKNPTLKPGFLFNSLEQVTTKLYPEVGCIKEKLASLGLKNILMSGSGPAVFAIVSSGRVAGGLVRKINKEGRPWRTFAVSTV